MGRRITQRILECSLCGKIPEDGEHIWMMGGELWCAECCDKMEKEQENELKYKQKQALIDTMRGDEEIGLYDDNPKNHGYER